jgi:hypothetical protein
MSRDMSSNAEAAAPRHNSTQFLNGAKSSGFDFRRLPFLRALRVSKFDRTPPGATGLLTGPGRNWTQPVTPSDEH